MHARPHTIRLSLGLALLCSAAAPLTAHAQAGGTLAALMRSGEFTALYKKRFRSPIPPKGINLNAPMSQELQDNLKALSDKPVT